MSICPFSLPKIYLSRNYMFDMPGSDEESEEEHPTVNIV